MSGYASKAEVLEVVKATIRQDSPGTGLSRDPADYNLSALVRDLFYYRGRGFGWGSTDADFAESMRRNLRKPPKNPAKPDPLTLNP